MIFKAIRTMAMVVIGALAPVVSAPAKSVSTDAEVQMLANFPALQRLAAKGDRKVIRRYLAHVAAAYRAAGYDSVAATLPKADALIALFGNPDHAVNAGALKQARASLRRLKSALAKNPRIVIPLHAGDQIPNYYALAAVLVDNSTKALKNLSAGKNVANTLRQNTGTLVIKNETGTSVIFSGTGAYSGATIDTNAGALNFNSGTLSAGSLTKTGAGTLILSGANTYAGSTIILGGILTETAASGSLGGNAVIHLSSGSSLNLREISGYRWVAFPPDVTIPDDWSSFSKLTLSSETPTSIEIFPGGTRIVKAPADVPLPDGAVEIPAGITLQPALPIALGGAILGNGTLGNPTVSGSSGTLTLTPIPGSNFAGLYNLTFSQLTALTLSQFSTAGASGTFNLSLQYSGVAPTPSPTPAE